MAWSRVAGAVRSVSAAAPASPWNAGNLGAAVLLNDRVFAVVNLNATAGDPVASQITDSLTNTWRKALSIKSTGGGAFQELSLWDTVSAAGTPSNITVTFAGGTSTNPSFSAAAYRGLTTDVAGYIDVSKMAVGAATKWDSGTSVGTTTAANELKIGFGSDWGDSTTLVGGTLDTTYTIDSTSAANANSTTAIETADSGGSGSTARATIDLSAADATDQFLMGVAVIKLPSATPLYDPPKDTLYVHRRT